MISRVLVPMDGSDMSEHALEYALEAYPEADVIVLHVVGEPSSLWGEAAGLALADDLDRAAEDRAADVFDRAREIVADADGDVDIETAVQLGQPVRAIIDRADDCDTVVVGNHCGGIADRLFTGNVAAKVVRRSPVPVVVVR